MKILALDPGGTTGWATAIVSPDATHIEWNHGQLGPHEHHDELWTLLAQYNGYTIVCERFEFRQQNVRDKVELISREYIGVAKLFNQKSWFAERPPLIFQNASEAKGFVSDKKLDKLGLLGALTANRHAHDAYRHLIYYLVVRQKIKSPITDRWL